MPGELGDRGEVKELGQVDLPRILAVDLLVDLDELERARSKLEEIVVDVHALAAERRIADRPQLLLDLVTRGGLGTTLCFLQCRQLLQLRIELTIDIALLEQVALNLAARR